MGDTEIGVRETSFADGVGTQGLQEQEVVVRFRLLHDRAILPAAHSEHAAGLDISACLEDDDAELVVTPIVGGGRSVLVRTGFCMAVPFGYEAQVRPRSGLGSKHGITLPNAPGTIDADYRGEVLVPLINLGQDEFVVKHGMRIAQMIIAPLAKVDVRVVTELEDTRRGEGGFGSSGV